MKIAVMTWFHYDNYGTVLQAAALSRVLKGYGHQVDIIDYFPGDRCLVLPEKKWSRRLFRQWVDSRSASRDPVITTQVSGERFDAFRAAELCFFPSQDPHFCFPITLPAFFRPFQLFATIMIMNRKYSTHRTVRMIPAMIPTLDRICPTLTCVETGPCMAI